MSKGMDLSIANLSCLTQKDEFLLQVSTNSREITRFIEKRYRKAREAGWRT